MAAPLAALPKAKHTGQMQLSGSRTWHLEPQRAQLGASQQGLLTGHLVVRGTSWAGSAYVLKSRM